MEHTKFIRCRNAAPLGAALLAAIILAGCGGPPDDQPELGTVHGQVTLDGKPLPNAFVRFQPSGEGGGRPVSATTDEEGYYELQYTEGVEGAILGKHVVRIFTGQEGYDDGDTVQPPVPEQVPVQYNRDALDNPEMSKEIKAGDNEINFPLKSDGEIIQPASGEAPGRGRR